MGPHGRFMVDGSALVGTSPWGIRFWGRQRPIQPDDDVIVNHATLLEFGHPCIAHFGGAGAGVVPAPEGVEIPADVLGAPVAVIPCICQGLHPNLLVPLALVVELLRSDSQPFAEARNTRLMGVDLDGVFCTVKDRRTTRTSC